MLVFFIFLTDAVLDNLIPGNIMGLKILKWKCACGSVILLKDYLEAVFLEDMSTTLSWSSGNSSAEIIREQKDAEGASNC